MSQNHYADSHRIAVQSVSLLFANARCIDDLDCYLLGDKKSECERDLSANLADWDRVLGRRFAQRVDNFTRMALYCADQCLKQNRLGLTISDNNCTELGISVGNNYGGWDYVAPQMMDLYHHSMFSINPYVATAWFPAAAQGEIAIRYGIKGCSKTFSCDALSAGVALEYGCDLLEMGNIKYCLTGGVESPTSDIVQKHLMSKHRICDQFPVRRAACFLLLSRETGSAPLCYIAASVRRTVFHAALTECLDRYGKSVDYCMLPATNIDDSHFLQDQLEQELSIVGVCCPQAYVGIPARVFGFTGGASYALQVAIALWMLEKQRLPHARIDRYARCVQSLGLCLGKVGDYCAFQSVMVVEKDEGNQYQCTVFEKA